MENSVLAIFDEIWPMTLYFGPIFEQIRITCPCTSGNVIRMENSL